MNWGSTFLPVTLVEQLVFPELLLILKQEMGCYSNPVLERSKENTAKPIAL